MLKTNLQQSVRKSNSFNGKDFQTAAQLANQLKFQEFEVNEGNAPGTNWFGLFMADNNAYWSIVRTETGSYNLECDDLKVCVIDNHLEKKLDDLRQYLLGSEEREIQSFNEYKAEQNELWANYGYGKI
ncbi:hypothetical protein CHRYSEOSP005_11710 [Chryseobacterium sp. Alg-005]|uniref:hypothetical protein n=1 Tax=Chryseobacterium sp. Alg-005 TaxID=3159516 RepID=UPI003555B4D5